jgi:hypothetical protein
MNGVSQTTNWESAKDGCRIHIQRIPRHHFRNRFPSTVRERLG